MDLRKIKQRARYLRSKGLSYREIAGKLKIAKSTASLWCRDVPLTISQRKRLYTRQIEILSKGPQSSHERRKREIEAIIQQAQKEISFPLTNEAYRIAGAMLYWAEGDKTKHLSIANSDPHLVLFMVNWFKKILGVSPKALKAHLNIYPYQDENSIKLFWSQLTGIPLERFGKTFIKPESSGYKKNTLYYGTIKIRVPKGTNMRHRIFGWINGVVNFYTSNKIKTAQRRWQSLQQFTRR